MFGLLADLMSSVITIFFPVFASYKALRSSDPSQLAPWLMYWVVLSVILLAESWTVFIIGWFPFYSWIRLFFMGYLVLPQTQGARLIYQQYVDPFLEHHEREIEELIGHTHAQAKALGLQYFYMVVDLFREKILGLPHQQKAPPSPSPSGPVSYAQSLLSRFNLPATAEPSNTTSNDWTSYMTSALRSVTATGKSHEEQQEELSASGNLLQRQIQSMTPIEKAQYISSQRQVLDFLRSTLAREEQSMDHNDHDTEDLAYGGGGVSLRKNRSDNSFDVVDDDDLENRSNRHTSSRWGGWLGADHDPPKSYGPESATRSSGYDRY
ncbi:TB2/DP1/HVA22-related protein [Penicillium taxi]|uniref:TB2/DP1/HVA22-related protein n=1 Tax=Penicillium taxi TaxID=168475 RepID=UPI002545AACA|nr:TB2/DP1/HVA22-related protein [Penicillium taxi]KAJ5894926.1 TB2/DP1/HVA22-related protein [Penicillium taxi]